MLQVTAAEIAEVAAKSNLLQASKCSPAFAEHGAVQAANILNSDDAMEMNVHIVRALIYLRQPMTSHKALASKLAGLDAGLANTTST